MCGATASIRTTSRVGPPRTPPTRHTWHPVRRTNAGHANANQANMRLTHADRVHMELMHADLVRSGQAEVDPVSGAVSLAAVGAEAWPSVREVRHSQTSPTIGRTSGTYP